MEQRHFLFEKRSLFSSQRRFSASEISFFSYPVNINGYSKNGGGVFEETKHKSVGEYVIQWRVTIP